MLFPTDKQSILPIVKGFRNGIRYGIKVRFPHALIMTLIFKRSSLLEMSRYIFKATYIHAKNLALFVTIYKYLKVTLTKQYSTEWTFHPFFAAFIAGYLIFGDFNAINKQVNLYILSRVIYAFAKLGRDKMKISAPQSDVIFRLFSAVSWGMVLWLYEHHQNFLEPSLQSSMIYLYEESNH